MPLVQDALQTRFNLHMTLMLQQQALVSPVNGKRCVSRGCWWFSECPGVVLCAERWR